MFGKNKSMKTPTSYNFVFENGAKHWYPFKELPLVGSEIMIKEGAVKYSSEIKGKYIVTKIIYELSTTEQWNGYSNFVFIHVKQSSERVSHD